MSVDICTKCGEDHLGACAPKFANVSCSQCGRDFGPGDHGFSHCVDHTRRTFDAKCLTLAEAWLEDFVWIDPDRADDLAATIQQAIETWIANEESNQEYPDARTAEDWKTHAE